MLVWPRSAWTSLSDAPLWSDCVEADVRLAQGDDLAVAQSGVVPQEADHVQLQVHPACGGEESLVVMLPVVRPLELGLVDPLDRRTSWPWMNMVMSASQTSGLLR